MTTWTTTTRNPSTFTNYNKHSSSFSNVPKTFGSNDFLLMEDGFYLLLETGYKIILDQSSAGPITWTNVNKS